MNFFRSNNITRYLRDHDNHRSYALVTGASDGIGAALAEELAGHGFNLVLHGRNAEKLGRVRDSILQNHPDITIHTVIADASKTSAEMIEELVKSISNLPITMLINNVGGTGALDANFKTFATHTTTEIDALISINVRFTILLTHALMPQLKAQSPAHIMNIGSQASSGVPYLSIYSGTKGFIHAFTNALAIELAAEGNDIEVLEILVASVQTQQNQTDKATLFVPDAKTMARASLDRVGKGSGSSAPYWPHALQQWGMWAMPSALTNKMVAGFLKPLAGKRERKW